MSKWIQRLAAAKAIASDAHRFFTLPNVAFLMGLCIHACLIPVFLSLGIQVLVGFNAISVLLYLLCICLNQRDASDLAKILGICEVCAHAWLAVTLLGWGSGFHYFILALVPLIFLNPSWNLFAKVVSLALLYGQYVFLLFRSRVVPPVVTIPPSQLDLLNGINICLLFGVIAGLAFSYTQAIKASHELLLEANKKLELLATIDDLTHLINRRNMIQQIEYEMIRFLRSSRPFSLVLGDIDDFKQFNDRYGHDCGDFLLVQLADLMKTTLRMQDVISRWGGEEFLILLPETSLEEGQIAAERLRKKIEEAAFRYRGNDLSVTMTFGVCTYHHGIEIDPCIRQADRALYQGKQDGKNQVRIAQVELEPLPEAEVLSRLF